MMDGAKIIGTLESLGYNFRLAVDYEHGGSATADEKALLEMLSEKRGEAIDYLIAGRFVKLPDDIAIPAEWNMTGKMKRYILDAPGQIIQSIEERHSPLFALLWAVKALCFIKGGKTVYERVEAVLRDVCGFDYERYSEDWRRYTGLLDTSPLDVQAKIPEYLEVQARLREAGARI